VRAFVVCVCVCVCRCVCLYVCRCNCRNYFLSPAVLQRERARAREREREREGEGGRRGRFGGMGGSGRVPKVIDEPSFIACRCSVDERRVGRCLPHGSHVLATRISTRMLVLLAFLALVVVFPLLSFSTSVSCVCVCVCVRARGGVYVGGLRQGSKTRGCDECEYVWGAFGLVQLVQQGNGAQVKHAKCSN
jgi:hypothetical protein